MTVQLPEGTTHKDIILIKGNERVKPSEHITIVKISPTTVEIRIVNAKPEDEGKYSVIVDKKEQPLIELKVIPKPVTHQTLDLPQTKFNEGDTLTIKCQFDTVPEETFEFLRNGKPLVPDDRISTTIEENTYTIVVKDLKPVVDEGVYTLKSEHLILDTPSIKVIRLNVEDKPKDTENIVEEEFEEETIVIEAPKRPEVVDIEIIEKEKDQVSVFRKTLSPSFPDTNIFHDCDTFHCNNISFTVTRNHYNNNQNRRNRS
jgi:hypothetical protein